MADVTGALHHDFGGKSYTLRLTMSGLAKLQAKHGGDFLSRFDPEAMRKNLPIGLMLDVVIFALVKGEKMTEADATDLADDMLTGHPTLAVELIAAAFPDAGETVGNGQAVDPAAKAA